MHHCTDEPTAWCAKTADRQLLSPWHAMPGKGCDSMAVSRVYHAVGCAFFAQGKGNIQQRNCLQRPPGMSNTFDAASFPASLGARSIVMQCSAVTSKGVYQASHNDAA
jgi:hypothetical protein